MQVVDTPAHAKLIFDDKVIGFAQSPFKFPLEGVTRYTLGFIRMTEKIC
jgi:hypothetical protein